MANKIRYVDSQGNIRESERPPVKPLTINGEEGFGVYHSSITVTPTSVENTGDIKPRFFSEEVADQRTANEVRRKQADEKVKQMLSGKEYAKLGGLTLAGAAAAGAGAYALPALASYVAPGTVGGNLVGDMAGGLALGTAMEEGQRTAFGQSAGDILYKQVKPYLGDSALGEFAANMVRPEYWVAPSMLFKGTLNSASESSITAARKQYEREMTRLISPISKATRRILLNNPLVYNIPEYKQFVENATTNLDIIRYFNSQQGKLEQLNKAISGVEKSLTKSRETTITANGVRESQAVKDLQQLANKYDDLQKYIQDYKKFFDYYNTKGGSVTVNAPKFEATIEVPHNQKDINSILDNIKPQNTTIYVNEKLSPIQEEFVPTESQLQEEVRGLRNLLQEKIGNNGVITGSSVGVSEGWIPERPGDVEIITTEGKISPIRDYLKNIGFNLNHNNAAGGEAYSGNGVFTMPTKEQKIELNSIREVDGKATGSISHQIYAFLHPEEYSKFLQENKFKVQHGKVVEQNTHEIPLPISAEELFNEYNSNSVAQSIMPESNLSNSSLMNLFDILTVYNDKSAKRAVNVLMNPKLVPIVDKLLTRSGKRYFGSAYTPASSHYNISFQDIEQNKQFLKFLNEGRFTTFTDQQIDKIANNPDQVRNIFNSWHQQNFIGIRKVSHNTSLSNIESLLFNRVSSSGGGTQSGPGLNHTTGYNPLRQSVTGVRPFYISYNPENIKSFSDFIKQYKRIYKNPEFKNRDWYHDSLEGIVQASERITNLSKQLDIPIFKGNVNKSYSFVGSFFPKGKDDLYAVLSNQNPEFGEGLTYLYGKDLFPTNNFSLEFGKPYKGDSQEIAQDILKNFNIDGYFNSSGQVNWRKFTLDLQRAYPNSSITFQRYNSPGLYDKGNRETIFRNLDAAYKQRSKVRRSYYKNSNNINEELRKSGAFTRDANNTEALNNLLSNLKFQKSKIEETLFREKTTRDEITKNKRLILPTNRPSSLVNKTIPGIAIINTEVNKK